MARTTTWVYEGRGYTTGAAGTRCYEDLIAQRGKAAADRVRDRAVSEMPRVKRLFPGGRGQATLDVTVEAFLLAAGVPDSEVERLARRYRTRSGAPVDLAAFADDRDPTA